MEAFLEFIGSIMEISPDMITMNSNKDEIEKWDSLLHLRLVMEIEQKYGIEIPFDEIARINKIGDFYKYIES